MDGKEVQNLVFRVACEIGAECVAVRTALDFHRFKLMRGEEREIIANKLATLLRRTELKDVVDLYFLEKAGHDLLAAIPDA